MEQAIKMLIGTSGTDDRSPSKGDSRGSLGNARLSNTLRGRGDSPHAPIRTRAPLAHGSSSARHNAALAAARSDKLESK
eukprot:11702036-Heterocapsa_arctica.AAC.1